jgi:monoamine oxidase
MSDLDIAIVGGGVSGLYAAWRLSTLPNPPKVALFESSVRLGGRIDTAELPGPQPAAKAEFGAMRFLPSMEMVANLLQYLGIPTEPFPGTQLQEEFLRGVQVNLSGPSNLPYRLAPGESSNPGELLVAILNGAVPGATGLNAKQWREVVQNGKYRDRELWRWGFENVATDFISNEAYEYLCDTAGLDSALVVANAANSFRGLAALLPDYAAGKVFRPVEGFSSLIDALTQRLASCKSFSMHPGQTVISVERAVGDLLLSFAPPGGTSQISADQVTAGKVIFALPRRALELINFGRMFPDRSEGRTLFMRRLAGVNGIPAFKLCIAYDEPWWQSFRNSAQIARGWTDGYAVTDLPLRQVFFGLGVGSTPAANERVLLASYADTRAATYWTSEAQVSGTRPLLGAQGPFQPAGPGILTEAINGQLSKLLQMDGPLPEPCAVGFRDWSADPFGGGWHEWQPGVDVTSAIPAMRHPIPDASVYVCGEAYSWFQSWIEGALMSAERMLQDHFQLGWPEPWLPRDYDLGP